MKKILIAIIILTVRYAFSLLITYILTITFNLEYNVFLLAIVVNIGINIIDSFTPKKEKPFKNKWGEWK